MRKDTTEKEKEKISKLKEKWSVALDSHGLARRKVQLDRGINYRPPKIRNKQKERNLRPNLRVCLPYIPLHCNHLLSIRELLTQSWIFEDE